MKPKLILVLALAAFTLHIQAQILADEISVLKTPSGSIEGTLLCPYTSEKAPLVLIIAGSGPTDRDGNNISMKNNSLKLLAEGLKANHIASLRYDKRGIGKSASAAIQESDLRFEHYVEDAKGWVKLLKKDDRFSSIIIAGHSEGSLIGMLASQDADVDKYISIAGAGYPAADIIRKQLEGQAQGIKDQAFPILEQLEAGNTVTKVEPMLSSLFRPSVQGYMISWFRYAPQEEMAKLTCPILIVQGTTDIQVSTDNAKVLKQANSKAQLSIIEGMNHILKDAPADRMQNIATYSQANLSINNELIKTITNFITTPSL